jgi:hypothetical protein
MRPHVLLSLVLCCAALTGCKSDSYAEKKERYRRAQDKIIRATQYSERHLEHRVKALDDLARSSSNPDYQRYHSEKKNSPRASRKSRDVQTSPPTDPSSEPFYPKVFENPEQLYSRRIGVHPNPSRPLGQDWLYIP